ncbi:hypothetical protein [Bradyrhizobium sp. dw_411]|uniref:hypothetical protein n=1 Tax=Bradyrhizobium sp. dw_411 TaxID=2720082 RepID=UPI001BCE99F4|nr:hypothetical protein [Bradyrhizobium sp. dw_411]
MEDGSEAELVVPSATKRFWFTNKVDLKMVRHPCDGLMRAETKAFEAIAINLKPRCSVGTLTRLVERGLIVRQERRIAFGDGLPAAIVDEYYVPLPIHIQFCEWAADHSPRPP